MLTPSSHVVFLIDGGLPRRDDEGSTVVCGDWYGSVVIVYKQDI